MQYSINVSSEPKFKFSDIPRDIVIEQDEEQKSSHESSNASSLVTEEDTSGNPLPPEIIKIRKRNKQLQKDLTNSIMNYKSSSRSLLSSDRSGSNLEEEKKNYKNFFSGEKKTDIQINNFHKNQEFKQMLDQIVKMQIRYENAKNELKNYEESIYDAENEYLTLKIDLHKLEDEIKLFKNSHAVKSNCNCFLL